MGRIVLILLFTVITRATAIIYQLNETMYASMPPLYHLDPYEPCVSQEGGIYCTLDLPIVSDDNNELYTMMKEYSARVETHFNHTKIFRGVCVTRTCKKYLKENPTEDLEAVIERCLNDSLWEEYKLKSKIQDPVTCNIHEKDTQFELIDILFVSVFCGLIFAVFIGSVYDFFTTKNDIEGNKWLLCFSFCRNFRKLTASSESVPESRTRCFKCFDGMKAITIFLVILQHSFMPFVIAADNPHLTETSYNNYLFHVLFDGTVVVQTFFFISGCLLAFYLEIASEKLTLNWKMIPKGIALRWLRLTPSYAFILAYTITWARYAGSGVLWNRVVNLEVGDCRRDGWMNMLYFNNYIDRTQCMMHTWYLAAEMQVFIVAMVILILTSGRVRSAILYLMLVISIIIPALETYRHELYAYFTVTPEFVRRFFRNDPTFNSHRRGHNNMTSYFAGIILGQLIYKLQQENVDIEKYKRFRALVWATVPVGVGLILFSGLFYIDGYEPSLLAKSAYSAVIRAIYGFLLFILILGMAMKIEDTYRGILEWPVWTLLSRVSYTAYLLHYIVIQIITGARTTLIHSSYWHIFLNGLGTPFLCYLLAFPFWLIVEKPCAQLLKMIFNPEDKKTKNTLQDKNISQNNEQKSLNGVKLKKDTKE